VGTTLEEREIGDWPKILEGGEKVKEAKIGAVNQKKKEVKAHEKTSLSLLDIEEGN